MSYSICCSH